MQCISPDARFLKYRISMGAVQCNVFLSLLKLYNLHKCMQVFEKLEAGELDGSPDAWTHAALCLAYRRGGQFPAVLEVYNTMAEGGMPIYKDVFYAVLEACERLDLWKEGRQILQHIKVDFDRSTH